MSFFKLALLVSLACVGSFSKTVFGDLFVFRTGNSVFSLSSLKTYSLFLQDLKCFYPESLAFAHFQKLASAPKEYFEMENFIKKNKTVAFATTTKEFVSLMKFVRYASSQSVGISSELPKAFKMSAQRSGCDLRGFDSDGLKEEMANLVLLEVFLRSRFAPGQTEPFRGRRLRETLSNIASLQESVNNQIEYELFEN